MSHPFESTHGAPVGPPSAVLRGGIEGQTASVIAKTSAPELQGILAFSAQATAPAAWSGMLTNARPSCRPCSRKAGAGGSLPDVVTRQLTGVPLSNSSREAS